MLRAIESGSCSLIESYKAVPPGKVPVCAKIHEPNRNGCVFSKFWPPTSA